MRCPHKIFDIYRLVLNLDGDTIIRHAGPNEYILTVVVELEHHRKQSIRYVLNNKEIRHIGRW